MAARADAPRQWVARMPSPCHGAIDATIFTSWIHDPLKPYAVELLAGHPLRMGPEQAVTAALPRPQTLFASGKTRREPPSPIDRHTG